MEVRLSLPTVVIPCAVSGMSGWGWDVCVLRDEHAACSKLVPTIHIISATPLFSHTYAHIPRYTHTCTYLGTNETTPVSRPVELAWGATD